MEKDIRALLDLGKLKAEGGDLKKKLKAILTTDFTTNVGADLPAEQAQQYIDLIQGSSDFLMNRCTFTNVGDNLKGELPRQHLNDPITIGGAETETSAETGSGPAYDALVFTCLKTKVRREISIDALHIAAIGKATIEEALLGAIESRASMDKEDLAFNGDTVAYTAGTDAWSLLRKINDGWAKLAQRGHVLDAGGSYLTTDVLFEALDAFPEQYWTDDIRWIGNRKMHRDFVRLAAAKSGGDVLKLVYFKDPISGVEMPVIEAPYLSVPSIPKSLAVSTSVATPAQVLSELRGPFQIITTNRTYSFTIDGQAVTGNFDLGLLSPSDMAQTINTEWTAKGGTGTPARDYEGFLMITCPTPGAGHDIVVNAVGNSFYLTVSPGATGGIVSTGGAEGEDAGTVNTQREGSYILLTDPRNLHYIQSSDIRMTVRYEPDTDKMQIIIYEYSDMLVERPEACVLVKNLRAKRSL